MRLRRRINPWFRRALLALALILIPLSLLGVHVLIQREFAEVRNLRTTAEQTVANRDELAQLLALHLDVETGVRGYVLTGDKNFLRPYLAAIPQRDAHFARLSKDIDSDRQTKLNELMRLSDEKLAHAALNVSDMLAGDAESARRRIAEGHGRDVMDAIRSAIAEMDSEESERLSTLTKAGSGSRDEVERSVTFLVAALAVLLIFVAIIVSSSFRQRHHALERVELLAERQKAMFDGAVDGMLWLDQAGNILRMNPSIIRMFGFSENELIGQHNLVLMQHEHTLEESRAWLASVGEAGADGAGKRQEFIGQRADGSTFETEVAISRVEGEDDGAYSYIASIRDISHRKRAERMKTEFVSTVSHELRTPLTSIAGSLGLVMGGAAGQLEEKPRRLISIAHANCERLIRLINDILDIEKIESGKMEFDYRRVQIGALVNRISEAMTGFAEKHEVSLAVNLPPWPQFIMGDPDRLDQLLTNLISNAIKHSPSGETVEIVGLQHGKSARIEVRDRGAGIPLAFRDRIFGKFAMADASDSRTKGGTGLGLSIAREIAGRHGGEIGFVDRAGGGTIFCVDLPLAGEQPLEISPTDKGLPLVLHLDDDVDCLTVVAGAFANRARVQSVASLSEALDAFAFKNFAALVIDIGLDGANGLTLVEEVRKTDPNLPIILFTAMDESLSRHGADRLLIKSRVSVDSLVETTMDLVAQRTRKAA